MKKQIYMVSVICFICDLVSKLLVLKLDKIITVIPNFFYIILVKNTGAAFSSLEGFTYLFIFIGIFALFYIVKYINKISLTLFEKVGYSLLIGGILGNLYDRIVYDGVIDFLSFTLFGYNFPVFNLADVFICIGVFFIFLNLVKGDINENSSGRK